jgi:hypothetical protein
MLWDNQALRGRLRTSLPGSCTFSNTLESIRRFFALLLEDLVGCGPLIVARPETVTLHVESAHVSSVSSEWPHAAGHQARAAAYRVHA